MCSDGKDLLGPPFHLVIIHSNRGTHPSAPITHQTNHVTHLGERQPRLDSLPEAGGKKNYLVHNKRLLLLVVVTTLPPLKCHRGPT